MLPTNDLPQDDRFNYGDDPIPSLPLGADISTVDPKEIEAAKARVAEFRKRFPQGEPAHKPVGPWRMYIYTDDISLMYQRSLRWAQQLLQNTRFVLGKKKNDFVTVREFCSVNNEIEEEIRAWLNKRDEDRAKELEEK